MIRDRWIRAFEVLGHGFSRDGATAAVELPSLQELPHYGRCAAGAVIAFAEIGTGRLDIGEQRDIETMDLPVIRVKARRPHASPWPQDGRAAHWSNRPIAELTRTALRKASRVRMSDGFRSSKTSSTARRPVR